MTFIPKSDWSFDDFFWRGIPENSEGKIVSLEKLKELFPDVKIVKEESKQIIYGMEKEKFVQYIAYHCLECDKIIFGPPKKNYFNNLDTTHLSGASGSNVYCHNCNSFLNRNISEIS